MAGIKNKSPPTPQRILLIEPFYGGSHKQLIDTIMPLSVDYDSVLGDSLPDKHRKKMSKWPKFEFTLCQMGGKKWHWRARTAALFVARTILPQANNSFDILFCSSVLNLAELIALRPDIGAIPFKIIYFHENQLAYPVKVQKERDFQYGYNQILSCLVADQVVFNSHYNQDSFLLKIKQFLKIMPDYRPPDIEGLIRSITEKAKVLYFPIKFCNIPLMHAQRREKSILHIIWPHRWEHDKNPETFFEILFKLKDENFQFKVSVLGQSYSEIPPIFEIAKEKLSEEIVNWGFVESKQDYYEVLANGNVVLSTAIHEFFGVSMLEAAYCGCYPLCPSRLVYPELFPSPYLYDTETECLEKLKQFAQAPDSIPLPLDIAFETVDWTYCQDEFKSLFCPDRSSIDFSGSSTTKTLSSSKSITSFITNRSSIIFNHN